MLARHLCTFLVVSSAFFFGSSCYCHLLRYDCTIWMTWTCCFFFSASSHISWWIVLPVLRLFFYILLDLLFLEKVLLYPSKLFELSPLLVYMRPERGCQSPLWRYDQQTSRCLLLPMWVTLEFFRHSAPHRKSEVTACFVRGDLSFLDLGRNYVVYVYRCWSLFSPILQFTTNSLVFHVPLVTRLMSG